MGSAGSVPPAIRRSKLEPGVAVFSFKAPTLLSFPSPLPHPYPDIILRYFAFYPKLLPITSQNTPSDAADDSFRQTQNPVKKIGKRFALRNQL